MSPLVPIRRGKPWIRRCVLPADNIMPCSTSREEEERKLEEWRRAMEERKLKINRKKTECLIFKDHKYLPVFSGLFLAYRVAGMTYGLPTLCSSFRLFAHWGPVLLISRRRASFHYVFDRPLFISPCVSVQSHFLSMCPSSLLVTCPCQFNRLSVIFVQAYATLACCLSDVFFPYLVFACHSANPP